MTSQGVGADNSDGFFLKIDKNGGLRHVVQLRGTKANTLTSVQNGGLVGTKERVVITGVYGGMTAQLWSVTRNSLVFQADALTSNSNEDKNHGGGGGPTPVQAGTRLTHELERRAWFETV